MAAPDQGLPDIQLDATALYREDVYTDRRAGTIRVMTPVTPDGAADHARPTLYAGQTQLMTPGGVLPLMFEIEASSLAQAIERFPEAVKRANLVALLDGIGVAAFLGIDSCARLFADRSDLVHFTSALRFPVTLGGKNYGGTPDILATEYTRREFEEGFLPEVETLRDALWVPLGPAVTAAIASVARRGVLEARHVLAGLPHPSGANAERIAYFLGRKARENLSSKVDPARLDTARSALLGQIAALAPHRPASRSTDPAG